MVEFSGEQSVVIRAPVGVVYEYLSDFPRHVEWNHQPTEMTKLTDGPVGVGSVFRTREQVASTESRLIRLAWPLMGLIFKALYGATGYTEATITALEPGRRIAWKAAAPTTKVGDIVRAEWEVRLDSQDAGTLVSQSYHYENMMKMAERMDIEVVAARTGQEVARNLRRLKSILEAQTAPARSVTPAAGA